jgi:hypothetical protein
VGSFDLRHNAFINVNTTLIVFINFLVLI